MEKTAVMEKLNEIFPGCKINWKSPNKTASCNEITIKRNGKRTNLLITPTFLTDLNDKILDKIIEYANIKLKEN